VFTPFGRTCSRFAAGSEWVRPVVESYGATVGLHSRRQFENSRPPFLSCVCQIQEAKVKRVILGAAATAVAATAAVLVPNVAGATGSTGGTSDSVYIYPYADYNLSGASLDLDLVVKCKGPLTGTVNGSVTQQPPETPAPVTLSTGFSVVVCDGKSHSVGLTVDGIGFDDGKAKATVSLVNVNSGKTTTVTAPITIVAH